MIGWCVEYANKVCKGALLIESELTFARALEIAQTRRLL